MELVACSAYQQIEALDFNQYIDFNADSQVGHCVAESEGHPQ